MFEHFELSTALAGSLISWVGFYAYGLAYQLYFDLALRYRDMKVEVLHFKPKQLGPRWWTLLEDMVFTVTEKGITTKYRLVMGFCWNGASIPPGADKLIKPEDNLVNSGPHDQLYGYHWIEAWDDASKTWIRVAKGKRWSDALYFALSEQINKNPHNVSEVMFNALHVGGHAAWRSKTCNKSCEKCPSNSQEWCPYKEIKK